MLIHTISIDRWCDTLTFRSSASVVKLVYTTDSKSVAARRGGSSPPTGTIYFKKPIFNDIGFFIACNKVATFELKANLIKNY